MRFRTSIHLLVHACISELTLKSVFRTGGPLRPVDGKELLPAPPVSVVLDQRMIQKALVASDGEKRKQSILEKDLFAVSCTVTDDAVTLCGFDVTIQMDSPTSSKCVRAVSDVA